RAVCSALWRALLFSSFSSNRTVPSETSSLSLHDALPISLLGRPALFQEHAAEAWRSLPLWSKIQFSKGAGHGDQEGHGAHDGVDRRSGGQGEGVQPLVQRGASGRASPAAGILERRAVRSGQ